MSTLQAITLDQLVDTGRYRLSEPGSAPRQAAVSRARRELAALGCTVLPGFIRPSLHELLRQECADIAPRAYFDVETVNVYNTDVDAELPRTHPGRRTFRRGNAFVARDRMPADSLISRLYSNEMFQGFIADCFALPRLHELADPLSGLVLNVVQPGMEHPGTSTPMSSPSAWSPSSRGRRRLRVLPEHQVRAGRELRRRPGRTGRPRRGADQAPPLKPGDLQLFKGRYSLHRVSPVQGGTARHCAIFAYSERPGVIGSVARTRQLFGRVLPEHLAAEGRSVRGDTLLD
ncbi:arpA protein [Streptomyces sp. M10(2022)]